MTAIGDRVNRQVLEHWWGACTRLNPSYRNIWGCFSLRPLPPPQAPTCLWPCTDTYTCMQLLLRTIYRMIQWSHGWSSTIHVYTCIYMNVCRTRYTFHIPVLWIDICRKATTCILNNKHSNKVVIGNTMNVLTSRCHEWFQYSSYHSHNFSIDNELYQVSRTN